MNWDLLRAVWDRVWEIRSWDSTGAVQSSVGVRVRKIPDDLRIWASLG